jgi:hypothetical protein
MLVIGGLFPSLIRQEFIMPIICKKEACCAQKKLCIHEKMLLAIVFIPILAAMAYVAVQLYWL